MAPKSPSETTDKQPAATRPHPFLSFEVEGELLHIIADPAGLSRLKRLVERLEQSALKGVNDDAHLFAESWGGYDLNEIPMISKAITIKQVDFRVRLPDSDPLMPPNNSLERTREG